MSNCVEATHSAFVYPRSSRLEITRSRVLFFFSSRRRHTRCSRDWSSDVCSSDLTSKLRAVAMRLSPGSNRTITSPRLTRSQRHSFFGLIVSATRAPHPLPYLTASSSLDPGGFQARGQNMNCAQCDQISDTRHRERNQDRKSVV